MAMFSEVLDERSNLLTGGHNLRLRTHGQTEVCHLWNLVAGETREGDVYRTLLDKLENARTALGGQVFDALGKLQFEGKSLRDLLLEAVRYGEQPEVRARLTQSIADAVDPSKIRALLEESALAHDVMDVGHLQQVREEMDRAAARRLQPNFIRSFFMGAFQRLGGAVREREPGRYEVTHVPAAVRQRDRIIGTREAVLPRYERIAFDKKAIAPLGQPRAAFVCPGHPLLDATLDLTLERHRDLLRRGTVLVDDRNPGTSPRMLFFIEHAIQDGTRRASGECRTISKRILCLELDAAGNKHHIHYAPYLDYRPVAADEPGIAEILARPECAWITPEVEQQARAHAIARAVPAHIEEVRGERQRRVDKTRAAVKERLKREIHHWDHRANQLKEQEAAGKVNARLNSQEARRRADDLDGRLRQRTAELDLEALISALPPVVVGGLVIVPAGLLAAMAGQSLAEQERLAVDTQISAARARAIIMAEERRLGCEPVDREFERLGYDIESRDPHTGRLRFIEVKGRDTRADTVTVTRNEILYSLNEPDNFILALVEFMSDDDHRVHYVRRPFEREPDFGVTTLNYKISELLARAEAPR